jgi:hypothetical protein
MQGFLSLIANRYVAGLPVDAVRADHDTGTLTTEERRLLRGIRWRTSIQAFLISVVCAVAPLSVERCGGHQTEEIEDSQCRPRLRTGILKLVSFFGYKG